MKVLWLVPPTMNVETIVNSFTAPPHALTVTWFLGCHYEKEIIQFGADLIIYIGAVEGTFSFSPEILKSFRKKSKTLFISCQGGDPGWHPLLSKYQAEDTFDLVVNIDGNKDWPKRPQDLTLIGCVDPKPYEIKKLKERPLGCIAARHPERDKFLSELEDMVTMGPRNERYGSHQSYVDFLLGCEMLLNVNFQDPTSRVSGVNMKLFEAAYAGAIFLEKRNSVVEDYFSPGLDYLQYESAEDVYAIVNSRQRYLNVARNLRGKVLASYSNKLFWSQVFTALNL